MQTFLPYPDFHASARVLDYRRLGKQRVEARQILGVLRSDAGVPNRPKFRGPWRNHPAVLMWYGYENALIHYGNIMIREWVARGYKNTMDILDVVRPKMPPWLYYEPFHASHRGNLLRKNREWYGQFGWTERDDIPYVWPT
jgi:hypothetical protein